MESQSPPLWVQLALSTVKSRQGALGLIALNVVVAIYCLPWNHFINSPWTYNWYVAQDWSWSLFMLAVIAWYVASLAWMEKHRAW